MHISHWFNDIEATVAKVAPVLAAAFVAVTFPVGGALAGATSTSLVGPGIATTYGQTAEFTATVEGGGPGGTVTLKDGSKSVGSAAVTLLPDAAAVSAGFYHSCAVTAAGGVKCWGQNTYGQLGDGTKIDRAAPVAVNGLSSGVVAVVAARLHSCALTAAGGVKCWGSGANGRLGTGVTSDSLIPVAVDGLTSGVTAIAGGMDHTCALTEAGAMKCWGYNSTGQIGDGSTTNRLSPVQVSGLASGVTAITGNHNHTCAIVSGAAKCWGYNFFAQLGDGTTTDRHVPTTVDGLSSGVARISSGYLHGCALTEAGVVKCWGTNGSEQLGDGTNTNRISPVVASVLSDPVTDIFAGGVHTCVLTESGAAKCWGYNEDGSLGDGTGVNSTTPVTVAGFGAGPAAVSAGWYSNCGITRDGSLKCWGYNGESQIGDGTTTTRNAPVVVSGFGPGATRLFGQATIQTGKISAGTRNITARYNGDANNAASVSELLTQVVRKGRTKTRFRVKPRAPKQGAAFRLRLSVKAQKPAVGKPAGKVLIKDGRKKLGLFKVRRGKAGIRLGGLSQGSHKLRAVYRGDKNWKRSKATRKIKVR
ncbi:Ig-like domain repeat protein [Microbaculum sp. FT89]|uniref:Ig-like domain repeat protein n=1 Tax=Microbaculum sp. FT89 TaxID=3447298 RepID=UPI003F538A20